MKKIFFLIFSFSLTITAFAQKKLNSRIRNNETEIVSFIMGDLDLAYGLQLVYRLHIVKNFKIGPGALYGANYEKNVFGSSTFGYGAVFADALQLLGKRQKWGVGGQLGKGLYNRDIATDKIKAGIYYSVLLNYRATISKKLLFTTSLFIGHRNFHYEKTGYSTSTNNTARAGLKFGIIF